MVCFMVLLRKRVWFKGCGFFLKGVALFHYPSRESTIVRGFSGFQRLPYCLTGILLNIELKRNYLPGLSGNPFEPPHICPTGIYKKIPPIKDEGNLMFSQRTLTLTCKVTYCFLYVKDTNLKANHNLHCLMP